jgi:hypothetical protein
MKPIRGRIESLVMRIQDDFLRTPWLALTASSARRRFGIDDITSEAILDALADAHVVSKSRQGIYVRQFPEKTAPRAGARVRPSPSRHAA